MQVDADTFMTGLAVEFEGRPQEEPELEPAESRTIEEMLGDLDMMGEDDALARLARRVKETDKVVRKVGSRVNSMKQSVGKLAESYSNGSVAHKVNSIKEYQRKRDILDRYKLG
jgi:hypothetical protein